MVGKVLHTLGKVLHTKLDILSCVFYPTVNSLKDRFLLLGSNWRTLITRMRKENVE